MIRNTRRAALVSIGAGATLLATDTVAFSRSVADRSTTVDAVGDEEAYVALEGLREGEQYEEPHACTFTNDVGDDVRIELSVGADYVVTDTDPGINDGETIPPGGSASATIERDGGEAAVVEATVRTPDDRFVVSVSRTLSLSAAEPDETDDRFRIWLDADDGETVTTTDVDGEERVDAWGDRSDATGSADAADDATAPAYESDGWASNANGVVRFDEPEFLSPTADVDLADEEELTLFVALHPDDAVGENERPVSLANPDDDRRIYLDRAAGEAVVQVGDDAIAPAIDLSNGPLIATLVVERNGDLGDLQARAYRNGALEGEAGTDLSSEDAPLGTLPLGVGAKHDGTETFAGDVGEALLFESAFGEDDRVDVEDYLVEKWDAST